MLGFPRSRLNETIEQGDELFPEGLRLTAETERLIIAAGLLRCHRSLGLVISGIEEASGLSPGTLHRLVCTLARKLCHDLAGPCHPLLIALLEVIVPPG